MLSLDQLVKQGTKIVLDLNYMCSSGKFFVPDSFFYFQGAVEIDQRKTVGKWRVCMWKHNFSLIYGVWRAQKDGHVHHLICHYGS